jgi:hypothetical protein
MMPFSLLGAAGGEAAARRRRRQVWQFRLVYRRQVIKIVRGDRAAVSA